MLTSNLLLDSTLPSSSLQLNGFYSAPIMLIFIPFQAPNISLAQLYTFSLIISARIVVILIFLCHSKHFLIIATMKEIIFSANNAHIDSILILQFDFDHSNVSLT